MSVLVLVLLLPFGNPQGSDGKESAVQETHVRSSSREDPLEKGMATHSGILAWRIPWTEEPGGLQPMGLQRAWQGIVHGVPKSWTQLRS